MKLVRLAELLIPDTSDVTYFKRPQVVFGMHRFKHLRIWTGCLAIVCALWVALFFEDDYDRKQARIMSETHAANLVRAFEEHIINTSQQIDLMLLMLRHDFKDHPDRFDELLTNYKTHAHIKQILLVSVIDAQGRLVFSDHRLPETPLKLDDREHFRVHRDRAGDTLFISKPVLGRLSGKWSLQFTRKIINRDGSFGGVMVLSVDPEYFSSYFRSVDLGRDGVVTMIGTDRVIRARSIVEDYRSDAKGQALPADRPLLILRNRRSVYITCRATPMESAASGHTDGCRTTRSS